MYLSSGSAMSLARPTAYPVAWGETSNISQGTSLVTHASCPGGRSNRSPATRSRSVPSSSLTRIDPEWT